MLRALTSKWRQKGPLPDPQSVNYSREHVSLAKTIGRRRKVVAALDKRLPLVRAAMVVVATLWFVALPYRGLWKGTYVDEHAIQPAQVTMYFDWANVHQADRYLDDLERLVQENATTLERSTYLQQAFARSGLSTGNTSLSASTWAHVKPPRSAGTEAILISANCVSRDGTPNLRGVAMLLALGDFLRGQNHWAFDFILVIGEGYLHGLEAFMQEYHAIFGAIIWTGLNIDYPGHSFSHLGVFYEGVNGRLPNQDVVNTVTHVARYAGGVPPRIHDIDGEMSWHWDLPHAVKDYLLGAKGLWEHFKFAAVGRASGGHGVLARHRIDAVTLYCTPATGPHGFHTLGRTLESTLRSLNNLLERLHASYFFYLMPQIDHFIPVGNYLPIAVLLGASITLGGFDCPTPLEGIVWMIPAFALSWVAWIFQTPLVSLVAMALPKPHGDARKSVCSLTHLLYGALIPTLAMVNFPQAILLALIVVTYLCAPSWMRLGLLGLHPALVRAGDLDLRWEWETLGNVAWPAVFAVWLPLWIIVSRL